MKFSRALAAAAVLTAPVWAMFILPPPAPVDRLIQAAEDGVQKTPDDPQAYYRLGRIHYLALALKGRAIVEYPSTGTGRATGTGTADPPLSTAELTKHYTEALRNLSEAIRRDPSIGYFHLTMACVYEEGANLRKNPRDSQAAMDEYAQAFELSQAEDVKGPNSPVHGIYAGIYGLVSYEAATSYLRLGQKAEIRIDAAVASAMKDHLKRLEDSRFAPAAITPIIFASDRGERLDSLLDKTRTASFDLDGTGRPQTWTWVKPTTAILVWDPEHSGQITSGGQLFGNVTWWIFWENGYQALAALDDNRDGWLRGSEMTGLALWFDRNQNGRSDPGEVIPIEQTDVDAIAVRWDARESDGSLRSAHGIRKKDGSFTPSWDWFAKPAAPVKKPLS